MKVIKDIFVQIIRIMSEIEILFSRPNDYLFFRKLYLRLMKVKFGKILWVGRHLYLWNLSNLILGERCALGSFVKIENYGLIQIGDDFIGASGLFLSSGTHDPVTMQGKSLPIKIGNRVWCGINVIIIAGVTIGDDVVIGAGSVVVRDIPSNSIAVGVPAKVIKPLKREKMDIWTWAK